MKLFDDVKVVKNHDVGQLHTTNTQSINLLDEQKKRKGFFDAGSISTQNVHADVRYMIARIKSDTLPDVSEFETLPLGAENW